MPIKVEFKSIHSKRVCVCVCVQSRQRGNFSFVSRIHSFAELECGTKCTCTLCHYYASIIFVVVVVVICAWHDNLALQHDVCEAVRDEDVVFVNITVARLLFSSTFIES